MADVVTTNSISLKLAGLALSAALHPAVTLIEQIDPIFISIVIIIIAVLLSSSG